MTRSSESNLVDSEPMGRIARHARQGETGQLQRVIGHVIGQRVRVNVLQLGHPVHLPLHLSHGSGPLPENVPDKVVQFFVGEHH